MSAPPVLTVERADVTYVERHAGDTFVSVCVPQIGHELVVFAGGLTDRPAVSLGVVCEIRAEGDGRTFYVNTELLPFSGSAGVGFHVELANGMPAVQNLRRSR